MNQVLPKTVQDVIMMYRIGDVALAIRTGVIILEPYLLVVTAPDAVKTFGLLPDRAWIWLDCPDFKHDHIKEVYQSDVCFAVRGPVIFSDSCTRQDDRVPE